MKSLEQLLAEATERLKSARRQRENGEIQDLQNQQQHVLRETEQGRQKIERIKEDYALVMSVANQLHPSMGQILEYANSNQIYRGRSVNIPPSNIRRPIIRVSEIQTVVDYSNFVRNISQFPRPLREDQVIDFARMQVFSRDLTSLLKDPNNAYVRWECDINWPVLKYSRTVRNERAPVGPISPYYFLEEGFKAEISGHYIEVAQLSDYGTVEKRVSLPISTDIDILNHTLTDAFAGTLKESYSAEK